MNRSPTRSQDAASPPMIALSILLHGLLVLAVIFVYPSVTVLTSAQPKGVNRVKLVGPPRSLPMPEKMPQRLARASPVLQPEEIRSTEVKAKNVRMARETVKPVSLNAPAKEVIPLRKRKKPPRRVLAAKPKKRKKPSEKTPEKRKDPQSFVEKRLAAIRSNLEARKKDHDSPQTSQPPRNGIGRPSNGPGLPGAGVDEDLVRWFDGVRNLINSNWSVFGEPTNSARVTVVGVRIADDGALIDASVEESSGDPVMDRSAMRAVFLAAPFPPVPPSVKERILKAGGLALRFTPSGMR